MCNRRGYSCSELVLPDGRRVRADVQTLTARGAGDIASPEGTFDLDVYALEIDAPRDTPSGQEGDSPHTSRLGRVVVNGIARITRRRSRRRRNSSTSTPARTSVWRRPGPPRSRCTPAISIWPHSRFTRRSPARPGRPPDCRVSCARRSTRQALSESRRRDKRLSRSSPSPARGTDGHSR